MTFDEWWQSWLLTRESLSPGERAVARMYAFAAWDASQKIERRANANLAWEMQHEQFGGGSAIGDAIQAGERAKHRK